MLRTVAIGSLLGALGVGLGMAALPLVTKARQARVQERRALAPIAPTRAVPEAAASPDSPAEPAAAAAPEAAPLADAPSAPEPSAPEPAAPEPAAPTRSAGEATGHRRSRESRESRESRARLAQPSSPAEERADAEPDCEPSYTVDERGRKYFKPECLSRGGRGSARARVSPDCDPNFELDELGRKHFKPECFLNAKP